MQIANVQSFYSNTRLNHIDAWFLLLLPLFVCWKFFLNIISELKRKTDADFFQAAYIIDIQKLESNETLVDCFCKFVTGITDVAN